VTTLGIDIGGTCVRAAAVTESGDLVAEIVEDTPTTAAATEDLLVGMVHHLTEGREVTAVGLAVAGFVSTDCSRVMFAPHLAWRNAPVPALLSERVGLPVVMDHDVNCAAWAEHRSGAAVGTSVSLVIAVGTGIGVGVVIGGQLYRGRYGVAPELGHLTVVPDGRPCPCGKRGCLERYCSGTALVDEVLERIRQGAVTPLAHQAGTLTGRAVGAGARAGDPVAIDAFTQLGRRLGAAMAMVADILDPEIIVIGGGVSAAADLFLPTAREVLAQQLTGSAFRLAPRIAVAHHGTVASTIGAAIVAAERTAQR
jgi:glucokinase